MRAASDERRTFWGAWSIVVTLATGIAFTLVLGSAPALAAGQGKGYETGPLECGSTTYTVLATGFGSAFRVVDSTGVLVFRSGTLTDRSTGASLTFDQSGAKEGITQVRCTGFLVNPVHGSTYDVVFYMSIVPG